MKRNLVVILTLSVLLVSCNLGIPSTDNVIDRIPVLSSQSTILPSTRSVIPEGMPLEDFYYTIFAPPITKFAVTNETFVVGNALEVDIFSNKVRLETSFTDEGYIKFYGVLNESDVNKITIETGKIEIIYDKKGSRFSYYSEVLVADPDDSTLHWGPDGHFYVIHEIPFTKVDKNDSFVANFNTLVYIKMAEETLEVQVIDAAELYSGPGAEDEWIVGFVGTSLKTLENDSLLEFGLTKDASGSLVGEYGIPVNAKTFSQIRKKIVDAKEDLFAAKGTADSPFLGFRKIKGSSYETNIYLILEDNDAKNGLNLKEVKGNILSSDDGEIVFIPDGSDPPILKMNQSNIALLISGLPSAYWREKTSLQPLL